MIVAFVQTKGGVGKTTLAVNLAVERSLKAHRDVLLVDADEQGTASDFVQIRAERLGGAGFVAVALAGPAVRSQVLGLKSKFDDIVIDAGGRDTASLRAALTVADLAVLPFQPRSFDIWTIDKVSALIAEARSINPALAAVAILNNADNTGDDNRQAAAALSENPEIRYLDAVIGRRKSFANASASGLSVLEYTPKDAKAVAELTRLCDKIAALGH